MLILFIGIVSGAIWGYFEYENQLALATELNGIELGMTELEITLAKGAPTRKLDTNDNDDRKYLIYGKALTTATVAILKEHEGKFRVTDICDRGGYGDVLGFNIFSTEDAIVSKLGEPSSTSINETGTSKIINYPKWNAAFEIAQHRVVKTCVTSRVERRYATEYEEQINNNLSY